MRGSSKRMPILSGRGHAASRTPDERTRRVDVGRVQATSDGSKTYGCFDPSRTSLALVYEYIPLFLVCVLLDGCSSRARAPSRASLS